jgi:hypothetical protein
MEYNKVNNKSEVIKLIKWEVLFLKRAIIGGFISLIGSIWVLAIIISANNYAINGWTTPPGKIITQMIESNLMVWFGISVATIVLGIVLMIIEYFKKDN